MIDYPKTIEEAKEHKYSIYEYPYYEGCCAYEVSEIIEFYRVSRQCLKKNGYGPAKLYCKQHAKLIELIEVYQ